MGCFGLTEPNHGSDPGGMETRAKRDGDGYILNGAKMWITNGTMADVAVVWAKLDDEVRGFIVPTDSDGFSAPEQRGKHSLRASVTSELVMQDVRVGADGLDARREGPRRSALVPEPSALRHCLGCGRCGDGLLRTKPVSTGHRASSSASPSRRSSCSKPSSCTC